MTRTIVNLPSHDGGKGCRPRPILDKEKFESNWDAIFGKKPVAPEAKPSKADELPRTIGVNT
jgi:hypothetical protein